jgi:hypothetical protein
MVMKKLLLALLVALIGLGLLVVFGVVEARNAPVWVGGIVGAWLGIVWFWSQWLIIWWSGPRGNRKVGEAVLRIEQQKLEQKQRKEVRDGSELSGSEPRTVGAG